MKNEKVTAVKRGLTMVIVIFAIVTLMMSCPLVAHADDNARLIEKITVKEISRDRATGYVYFTVEGEGFTEETEKFEAWSIMQQGVQTEFNSNVHLKANPGYKFVLYDDDFKKTTRVREDKDSPNLNAYLMEVSEDGTEALLFVSGSHNQPFLQEEANNKWTANNRPVPLPEPSQRPSTPVSTDGPGGRPSTPVATTQPQNPTQPPVATATPQAYRFVIRDGKTYYTNGESDHKGWLTLNEKMYYFNADGTMATGWKLFNTGWYYFGTDGVMYKSCLREINGFRYYFNDNGVMHTGWLVYNNNVYYFHTQKATVKVVTYYNNKEEWHDQEVPQGAMAIYQWLCFVQTKDSQGRNITPYRMNYYMGSDGAMLRNVTLGTHVIDQNGVNYDTIILQKH